MMTILRAEAEGGDRRAASLDGLAGDLEREAAVLAARLDGVVRAFTEAVWRGPAADLARASVLAGQARVRGAADELRAVAALLRRRAGDARAQAADLRRQADRVAADPAQLFGRSLPS